jgi:hypothetical protein
MRAQLEQAKIERELLEIEIERTRVRRSALCFLCSIESWWVRCKLAMRRQYRQRNLSARRIESETNRGRAKANQKESDDPCAFKVI